MKKLFLFAVGLACAGQALADVNYYLAKKQAYRDAAQNNAQQGVQPPNSSAPAPAAPAAPMDPALAATLQNIADLRADLDAINQAADATAAGDQRASLMTHLSAAAAPGKKATTASVRKLAAQLITATSGKKNLTAQNAKLARDIHALFNGAHVAAPQQQTLLDGLKKILTEAGVAATDAENVVNDLQQVATETQ